MSTLLATIPHPYRLTREVKQIGLLLMLETRAYVRLSGPHRTGEMTTLSVDSTKALGATPTSAEHDQ